jgi:hypothetical protein
MATDNKKVSGYLPQYIFDLFEDFREKRSLSASSALIAILSEYFQVDHKVEQSSLLFNNDFVSREQFESLENKLSELSGSLLSELDKLVEQRFNSLRNELLSSPIKSIEVQTVNIESEPSSESLNEPVKDELPRELLSDPLKSEPLIEAEVISLFTLSEPSNSIQTKLLANRLNVKPELISKNKKEKPEQKFYDWLQDKDPDKISWQPVGGSLKGYSKGWIPAEDTPSELLSRLKEWLADNPE